MDTHSCFLFSSFLFYPTTFPPQYACCGGYAVRAWKEALLAAIVPDAEIPGASVLQLFSPASVIGGHEDDCLCSVGLPAEQRQTAGDERMFVVTCDTEQRRYV